MTPYIPQLYDFLRRLAANNNRDWFRANRAEYDWLRGRWEDDVNRLLTAMAQWEPSVARLNARECSYRIYRDTRFSPDKTPYKTHFSAFLGPYGKKDIRAGFYLETGPFASSGLYGGLWFADAASLRRLRSDIAAFPDEFRATVSNPELLRYFPEWCGDSLKTMPKGYDRNHPDADLLRRKDFGRFLPADEKFFADPLWPERAAELLHLLKPLNDFINLTLDNAASN